MFNNSYVLRTVSLMVCCFIADVVISAFIGNGYDPQGFFLIFFIASIINIALVLISGEK